MKTEGHELATRSFALRLLEAVVIVALLSLMAFIGYKGEECKKACGGDPSAYWIGKGCRCNRAPSCTTDWRPPYDVASPPQ